MTAVDSKEELSGIGSTGELLIEPPTLINLGFEWFIQSDDSRNAAAES